MCKYLTKYLAKLNWENMQVSKFEVNDESVQVSNQVPSETESLL